MEWIHGPRLACTEVFGGVACLGGCGAWSERGARTAHVCLARHGFDVAVEECSCACITMGSLGGPWVRGCTSLWGDVRDKNTKSTEHVLTCKSLHCVFSNQIVRKHRVGDGALGTRAQRESCGDVRAAKDAGWNSEEMDLGF
jgi:hypothetical protein